MVKNKFQIKDYKYLTKTDGLKDALTDYDGVIPILLKPFSDYLLYEDKLKDKGLFDKVIDEHYNVRIAHLKSKDKDKFREDELMEWLKDNPKFNNLLLESME